MKPRVCEHLRGLQRKIKILPLKEEKSLILACADTTKFLFAGRNQISPLARVGLRARERSWNKRKVQDWNCIFRPKSKAVKFCLSRDLNTNFLSSLLQYPSSVFSYSLDRWRKSACTDMIFLFSPIYLCLKKRGEAWFYVTLMPLTFSPLLRPPPAPLEEGQGGRGHDDGLSVTPW